MLCHMAYHGYATTVMARYALCQVGLARPSLRLRHRSAAAHRQARAGRRPVARRLLARAGLPRRDAAAVGPRRPPPACAARAGGAGRDVAERRGVEWERPSRRCQGEPRPCHTSQRGETLALQASCRPNPIPSPPLSSACSGRLPPPLRGRADGGGRALVRPGAVGGAARRHAPLARAVSCDISNHDALRVLAGMFLWLELLGVRSSADLLDEMTRERVCVVPGADHSSRGHEAPR